MSESEKFFVLSDESEVIVRNYECTSLHKLLGAKAKGFMTVSNKRVVYHSDGKSIMGDSLLINEMPVSDVSGISIYSGVSLNLLKFIIYTCIIAISTKIIFLTLPYQIKTSLLLGLILMIPLSYVKLREKKIINDDLIDKIKQKTDNIAKVNLTINTESKLVKNILIACFTLGAYFVLNAITSRISENTFFQILVSIVLAYILFNIRSQTFMLKMMSKTGHGQSIFISGQMFGFMSIIDTTSVDSAKATPSKDTEKMMKEIGALIMDISQYGDEAVTRWKEESSEI